MRLDTSMVCWRLGMRNSEYTERNDLIAAFYSIGDSMLGDKDIYMLLPKVKYSIS